MPYLSFATQSVGDAFRAHSSERLLNWYAQPWPQGASPVQLVPCPGLTRWKNVGAGAIYGMTELNGVLYLVSGGKLWSLTTSGVLAELGSVYASPATQITTQGRDIVVATNGLYAVYRPATATFSAPTGGAFAEVGGVCAVDGYILASEASGTRVKFSALDDATTFDGLDFFSMESAPGKVVAIVEDHQEVFVFGTRSTEIWVNTGGTPPFERVPGGVMQRGCLWGRSVASEDNGVFWVGDDRLVYRADGYRPARISTEAVERTLAQYAEADDVSALTYVWEGHKFYCLRFPDRPAWCYDMATGLWHERSSVDVNDAWIARSALAWNDGQAFGTETGLICMAGGETDDAENIVREATSAPLERAGEEFTVAKLEMLIRTGEVDIGRDAQAMLRVSRDGGRTYGVEHWRSLGRIGQNPEVKWSSLGQCKHFTAQLRISDPIGPRVAGVAVTLR